MSTCKQCGLSVTWKEVDGKWLCWNAGTETDHWDSCSQARFERIKREGQFFSDELAEGYYTDLKRSGVQYTRLTAKAKPGRPKVINTCDNCVPPWETCPNGCSIEFAQ